MAHRTVGWCSLLRCGSVAQILRWLVEDDSLIPMHELILLNIGGFSATARYVFS